MQPFSFSGKTVLVTGGGSGIGQSITEVFARQGAFVHILDRDADAYATTVSAVREAGGKAVGHTCDVANAGQVRQVFAEILKKTDRLDVLINNAAVAHVGTVETTTEEDLDRIYQVNIKGVFNCLQASVPAMKERGGGVILNLASVASMVGISERFAYSMSKGAVLTMTYSVAKDYLADNIRCNCIAPARVHTPFVDGFIQQNYPGKEAEMFEKLSRTQPIGRMGRPEEVAHLALYLCSDEAGFITGTNYPIDGGYVHLNS
ncbi:MAG: glucose 1-dehydrogenase [Tunicatimonas sp.]